MLKSEDVEKLAALARIELTEEERQTFAGEIDPILAYVSEVQKLSDMPPVGEMSDVHNVLRDDTGAHEPGAYTEALLKNAPTREGNYFRVKRIL